jgi:putative transposase
MFVRRASLPSCFLGRISGKSGGDLLVHSVGGPWACDFLCVRTVFFRTLYVFFVVDHANREVLHVQTTRHPTAEWASRQIIERCGWDREPPHFLIHDRDARYGAVFDRRARALGIAQIRTPFRSPQANSIAERWVGSLPRECLDYVFIFNESHLRAVLTK